jgi:MEMO1 family protein
MTTRPGTITRVIRNLAIFLSLGIWAIACSPGANAVFIRPAAVAGQFYPADPGELRNMVEKFLASAEKKTIPGRIMAGIAPHAGYVFSGAVAASLYAQLKGMEVDTIVLIGPSHHGGGFRGISVCPEGFYQTPLGQVEINAELAGKLLARGEPFSFQKEADAQEHCLEVQLPFIQTVFKNVTIVPILLGNADGLEQKLSKALGELLPGRKALVIASTDMTHYPDYDTANAVDRQALEFVKKLDVDGLKKFDRATLSKQTPNLLCTYCGLAGVLTVMSYAQKMSVDRVDIVKYANSGDVPGGSKDRVVGYSSVLFVATSQSPLTRDSSSGKSELTTVRSSEEIVSEEVGRELVKLARQTITAWCSGSKVPTPSHTASPYSDPRAVFVTLTKEKELRGCIGHILPVESLEQSVISNAVSAASKDPRFPAVESSELPAIKVEVSVLTVPKRIESIKDFIVGKQGIIMRKGYSQAVFLPQVATEQGWDKSTTMNHLSRKAGLPENAWQQGAEFSVFETQIFHESDKPESGSTPPKK